MLPIGPLSARRRRRHAAGAALAAALVVGAASADGATFLTERYEDQNLAARGWYDLGRIGLSTVEHLPGSVSSIEYHFPVGAATADTTDGMRLLFPPTPTVYLRFYVEYSPSWTGSDRPYHPHQFLFLTDVDSAWAGPAWTHLTLYIEQNEGEPLLAIQDGQNIDETNIGVDLTAVTEQRSVAGCNGDSDGYGAGDCYLMGAVHWNGKQWRTGQVLFGDSPGRFYKNDWHLVEAQFELNTIVAGVGVADGRAAYWFDGQLLFDHGDVVLRTGQWPSMQIDQILIAPYIGDGSPVDQTMWVDDLTIASERSMPLLRNDSVPTVRTRPNLASIFTGDGVTSLDLDGPDGIPQLGEGSRLLTPGSEFDDDYYAADLVSGATDPETGPTPIVFDATRPLVFYQLGTTVGTLRLVKTPSGSVRFTY